MDKADQLAKNDVKLSRRRFLNMSLGAVAATVLTGGYTWQIEPHWLEIVHRTLPVRGLPGSLVGRRLVQLSDLHVGGRVADEYLLSVFRTVATLRPDILVITGDFTSYHSNITEHARRVYSRMPRGRLATVGILGNHDHGEGWSDKAAADRLSDTLNKQGIRILRNELMDLSGLQIIGMDDLWAHEFKPKQAFAGADMSKAIVVLSHNPDTVDNDGWGSYDGWVLSGHTHGGQCRPPFLPPPLLPVENRRYTAGEFKLNGGRKLYISRGVGHLLQVRFNVRPEVTIFDLVGSRL